MSVLKSGLGCHIVNMLFFIYMGTKVFQMPLFGKKKAAEKIFLSSLKKIRIKKWINVVTCIKMYDFVLKLNSILNIKVNIVYKL